MAGQTYLPNSTGSSTSEKLVGPAPLERARESAGIAYCRCFIGTTLYFSSQQQYVRHGACLGLVQANFDDLMSLLAENDFDLVSYRIAVVIDFVCLTASIAYDVCHGEGVQHLPRAADQSAAMTAGDASAGHLAYLIHHEPMP